MKHSLRSLRILLLFSDETLIEVILCRWTFFKGAAETFCVGLSCSFPAAVLCFESCVFTRKTDMKPDLCLFYLSLLWGQTCVFPLEICSVVFLDAIRSAAADLNLNLDQISPPLPISRNKWRFLRAAGNSADRLSAAETQTVCTGNSREWVWSSSWTVPDFMLNQLKFELIHL